MHCVFSTDRRIPSKAVRGHSLTTEDILSVKWLTGAVYSPFRRGATRILTPGGFSPGWQSPQQRDIVGAHLDSDGAIEVRKGIGYESVVDFAGADQAERSISCWPESTSR